MVELSLYTNRSLPNPGKHRDMML